MTYIKYFLGSALLLLASVAGINFIVDPGNIYREGKVTPTSYANALVHSEFGLYHKDGMFDDRLLAKAIALKSFNADCIVVGSSHVMQVSSEGKYKALKNICGSILNLGVSGGAIEDHITLTNLALKNKQHGRPNKIFLGIDPWLFAFGKDQRWSIYRDDYLVAKAEILGAGSASNSLTNIEINVAGKKKLANLINLEYTLRSIRTILRNILAGMPKIDAAPKLDISVGGEYPIRLRDNSYVYSAKYIADAKNARIPLGGTIYATDGKLNQPNAINAYRDLIAFIKSKGVEPIFLMTPYHENVLKAPNSANAIALSATEPIVMKLAMELGVKVIGSYDPKTFGCTSNEFYDFMHPTSECLMKLRVRKSEVISIEKFNAEHEE